MRSTFVFSLFFLLVIVSGSYATQSVARLGPKVTTIGMEAVPNIAFSAEHGLSEKYSIGGALSLFNRRGQFFSRGRTELFRETESTFLEGHVNYVFREYSQDLPMDIAFTGGLWTTESKIALELGVLFNVPLSKEFTARFNLIFGPRAGIEIAYKVQKNFEFCLDIGLATGVLGGRFYL